MWAIEFTSDKFRPYLPEDSQVNPGVYGFELAAAAAGEGDGGKPLDWHIFIRQQEKPNKKKVAPGATDSTKLVGDAIVTALSAEGIAVRQVES